MVYVSMLNNTHNRMKHHSIFMTALLCAIVALPAAAANHSDLQNEVFRAAGSGAARLNQLLPYLGQYIVMSCYV